MSLNKDLAKEYKQQLGNRAMNIIAMGMGLSHYNPAKKVALCPFHKEKTPSFKWDSDKMFWKCFGCGETLDIYRYLQEFKGMDFTTAKKEVAGMTGGGIELSIQTTTVKYQKPKIDMEDVRLAGIEYAKLRGISHQTLLDWKVKRRQWNNRDCYVFQYFNEQNELEFVSYREIKKGGLKGGCEANTKSILWGMWHIDVKQPVIITEGQFDAMAVWEAGYNNVVSVPGGSNNFEWINHCWDWLETVDEFIIFGDNDEPGIKMVEELSRRLGKYRVKVVIHQHKDANEVLYRQGKSEIIRVIDEAIAQMPYGILDISKTEYQKYKNRIHDGIPTGIRALDSTIDDLKLGELSILFGRNGDGKSTVVSQILANNINNRIPVFLYSGELSSNRIMNWIFRQVVGNDKGYLEYSESKYGKIKSDITDRALEALRKWCSGLFFTYDKSVGNVRKDTNTLFAVMAMAVKRYGCKLLVVDNLMSAMEEVADSLNSDQSNFTQQCKDFAEAYNVHVMLVTHPNKLKKKGESLEKEDISGSNNIPNKADIIMAVERNYRENREYDVKIKLLKDREEGQIVTVKFMYNPNTKRLLELDEDIPLPIEYDWKKYLESKEWWENIEDIAQEELPF